MYLELNRNSMSLPRVTINKIRKIAENECFKITFLKQ